MSRIIAHPTKQGKWNFVVTRGSFDEIVGETHQGYNTRSSMCDGVQALRRTLEKAESIEWMEKDQYDDWRHKQKNMKRRTKK